MDVANLADLYNLPPLEWAPIQARLDAGISQAPGTGGPNRHSCWLTTINPDGSPHVTGIGALFVDGSFWFESGEGTRKARNLARDPRCALSLATQEFDLVVEGEARQVTDPPTVAAMATRWAAAGWPAQVDETGQALTAEFSARHHGSCTGLALTPPPHCRPWNPAARPVGGSELVM